MKQVQSAQAVWGVLADALTRNERLSRYEIAVRAGLTYSQVSYALQYVRDYTLESERQPLVCLYRSGYYVYYLPQDWADVKDYVDLRLRGILTQMRRLENNTTAAADKFGRRIKAVRLMERNVTRIREDLEEALAMTP